MSRRRRSYEAGHKPKLLVVIDDTEECDRAVYFASRRAARIDGNVIMLRVLETHDQSQQWLGVADLMRAEAREEADAELSKYAARARAIAGVSPQCVVREGDPAEEGREGMSDWVRRLMIVRPDGDKKAIGLSSPGLDTRPPTPLSPSMVSRGWHGQWVGSFRAASRSSHRAWALTSSTRSERQ